MKKARLVAVRAALLVFAISAGVVPPGLTPVAAAQRTGSDSDFPQPPAEGLSLSPSGIVNREPYVRWKNHTGSAAEAAVCVTVRITHPETGKTEVRRGSGFVVRCDGFVMVPATLISLAPGAGVKDQKNVLTFAAADGPVPPKAVKSFGVERNVSEASRSLSGSRAKIRTTCDLLPHRRRQPKGVLVIARPIKRSGALGGTHEKRPRCPAVDGEGVC